MKIWHASSTSMPMNANGVLARLYKHRNDAHTEPRVCYVPGCIQPAIWSHLMQKNGQLSELADASGHVVEPTTDDPFRARKAGDGHVNYYFRKIHKNEAFTFLGFCNEHDTNLFRSVETPGADITAGNGPMLLSYRGFLNELQKIENNRNWYRRIFKDRELLEGMACHEARRLARIRELDSAYRYVIEIEQRIKQAFEQELGIGRGPAPAPASHETAKFKFLCFTMERVPICTSSCFGGIIASDEVQRRIDAGLDGGYSPESYFVTISPSPKGKTTVVLGSYSGHNISYGPLDNEMQKRAPEFITEHSQGLEVEAEWKPCRVARQG